MTRLTPYPYQQAVIDSVVNEPTKASLIAAGLGSGKTIMGVEIVRGVGSRLKHPTVLVICPLATRTSWERTFKNQGLAVPVRRITSLKDGKLAMEALKKGEAGVYLIGREYFGRFDWSGHKKVGMAIVDEIHSFSARKLRSMKRPNRHSRLMSLKPEWRIGLSGTPWRNKFENAWAVTKWLWGTKAVPNGFWEWVSLWCTQEEIDIGYDHAKKAPKTATKILGEKDPGAFVASLPNYHRPQLPPHPVLRDELYVELTPAQRKMYDHFEDKSYVWLGDQALFEDIPIVERIRLREMTLGTVELDAEGSVIFTDDMKSAKVDALLEFLDDMQDEPVLILTHSKKFARIVGNRVPGSKMWTGDTKQEEREELIQTFGKDFKYLVATASALAEGVDGLQQGCKTMVWLSRTEDNTLNQQVEGRIARPATGGEKKQVLCVDILAKDTYDEAINNKLYFTERRNQQSLGGKRGN